MCLKRTLDATFLDCLALTFCDVIGELLPEWACLTLQGGTTFPLTSKLADIPVSRVRKHFLTLETGISANFDVRRNVVPPWRVRQAHSGSNSPMTPQNVNAKQSRKVASRVKNEKNNQTPHKPRRGLQILDTRKGFPRLSLNVVLDSISLPIKRIYRFGDSLRYCEKCPAVL